MEFRMCYPQNMAPLCIEYFKLEEFEKTAETGKSL